MSVKDDLIEYWEFTIRGIDLEIEVLRKDLDLATNYPFLMERGIWGDSHESSMKYLEMAILDVEDLFNDRKKFLELIEVLRQVPDGEDTEETIKDLFAEIWGKEGKTGKEKGKETPCDKTMVTLKELFKQCKMVLNVTPIVVHELPRRSECSTEGILGISLGTHHTEKSISPRLSFCLFKKQADENYKVVGRFGLSSDQIYQLKGFIDYLPKEIIEV